MSLRVVNLGLPKTGTTTLARAMKMSGFKVADHRIRAKQTPVTEIHDAFVGDLMYRGYFETGDPAAHMPGFDAIAEMSLLRKGRSLWPQCDFGIIDAIRTHHPEAKFVASSRDPFELSQSMLAWSDLGTSRMPAANIPGLPAGYGETSKERMQWIKAHTAMLRSVFAGDPSFLEFDIEDPDARQKISSHIGVELQWWGRANANRGAA